MAWRLPEPPQAFMHWSAHAGPSSIWSPPLMSSDQGLQRWAVVVAPRAVGTGDAGAGHAHGPDAAAVLVAHARSDLAEQNRVALAVSESRQRHRGIVDRHNAAAAIALPPHRTSAHDAPVLADEDVACIDREVAPVLSTSAFLRRR